MKKVFCLACILIFVLSAASAFASKEKNEFEYDQVQPGQLLESWLVERITDQAEAHFISNPSWVYEIRSHYVMSHDDNHEVASKRAIQLYHAFRKRGIPVHGYDAIQDESVGIVVVAHPPVGIGKGEARDIAKDEADRAVKKVVIPHLGVGPAVMALGVEGEGFVLPGGVFNWRSTYRLRLNLEAYGADNDFMLKGGFGIEAVRAVVSDHWRYNLIPTGFAAYLVGSTFTDNNASLTMTGGGIELANEFAYVNDSGSFGLSLIPSLGLGTGEWKQNENEDLRIYPDWEQVSQHPFLIGSLAVLFRF